MKPEKKPAKYNSVDEYLTSVDSIKAKTISAIIELIVKKFPQLQSKISWNVPTIHRQGKYIVGICAYKNHLTFSAFSAQIIKDFGERQTPFVVMKNCFQIPVDWHIDEKLVADLVRARLAELDADQA